MIENKTITPKTPNYITIRNAIISVFDRSDLDILLSGLVKYCPGIKIYAPKKTFGLIKSSRAIVHESPWPLENLKESGSVDLVVMNISFTDSAIKAKAINFAKEDLMSNFDDLTILMKSSIDFKNIMIVTDRSYYDCLLLELESHQGGVSLESRQAAASRSFQALARYFDNLASYIVSKQAAFNDCDEIENKT